MKAIVLALFLPITALATFDGRYSGPGTSLMHQSGNRRDCREIFLKLQGGEKALRILEGGYICGDIQASFDPFTLEIREGKIFLEGQSVGTISENDLDLLYKSEEENFTYHWHLQQAGDEINYLEEWASGGAPSLTVQGKLKKISP
ncbi:MAG: hypothetical protein AB7K68_02930 [Bacteriovoracia bacterium]